MEHIKEMDPINYILFSIIKPAHELLGMPNVQIPPVDPWAPSVLSGPQPHTPPSHGHLPVCASSSSKNELLQIASEHTQKASPTLQDWEKQ